MLKKFLCLISILLFSSNIYANYGVKVRISNPKSQEFFQKLVLPAHCRAKKSQDYFAQNNGYVTDIASIGKKIFKKGELIFSIDRDIYKAQIDSASSNLKWATLSFENAKKLRARKVISEEAFEETKIAYHTAISKYESAKILFENMVIHAPFDGEITNIQLKKRDFVKQGNYLFSISEGYQKRLEFTVPSNYEIDSKVTGYILHNNSKIILDNISISKSLDLKGAGFSSVAEINEDNNLVHNSFHMVVLNYGIHNGLGIKENAVIKEEGKNRIFIVSEGDIAKKLEVTLGDRDGKIIEIKNPEITENTKIITDGFHKLSGGEKLEIIE